MANFSYAYNRKMIVSTVKCKKRCTTVAVLPCNTPTEAVEYKAMAERICQRSWLSKKVPGRQLRLLPWDWAGVTCKNEPMQVWQWGMFLASIKVEFENHAHSPRWYKPWQTGRSTEQRPMTRPQWYPTSEESMSSAHSTTSKKVKHSWN